MHGSLGSQVPCEATASLRRRVLDPEEPRVVFLLAFFPDSLGSSTGLHGLVTRILQTCILPEGIMLIASAESREAVRRHGDTCTWGIAPGILRYAMRCWHGRGTREQGKEAPAFRTELPKRAEGGKGWKENPKFCGKVSATNPRVALSFSENFQA